MGFFSFLCWSHLNRSEGVVHSESALRESNVALAILENLDWHWFWDNMLLSHAKIINPCGFSSIPLQPIQSLEMVDMSSRHSFLVLEAERRERQIKNFVSCQISGETMSSSKDPPHPIITNVPKLETVPSSNQHEEPAQVNKHSDIPKKGLGRRGQRIRTKSTRYLDLYELKGFMDLGFRFNMDSPSPRTVSVISGLQQLREQPRTQAPTISRPYLSEAWLKQTPQIPLPDWQILQSYEQGVEMKKCLMFWARAVASTVRQEC